MQGTLTFPSQSSFAFQSRPRRTITRAAVYEASPASATAVDNRSLYEVLRVRRNASGTEIKTAYRTLAKLYHPDAAARFMDSAAGGRDFIEIRNAYATLSDPESRAAYDNNLEVSLQRLRLRSTTGSRGRFYPTRNWETDQCW
ncbi:hypothetical protein CASFOL_018727 [Castilleja foliolosa]|uniref:J domain-containing protein n=1 Tax=Castilleja foliolosa TaxID=1961234 RepID=A0ABD3D6U3_9LAMI